jgi:hippurate hydrolase
MMHDICGRISIEHNLEVTLTISEGYPAVVSDPDFVMEFEEVIAREGLAGMLQEMDRPSMVIEDFSYFLQRWPGTMVYVGAAVGEDPAFNHSAEALFDEDSMRTSFALFRALAPVASAN